MTSIVQFCDMAIGGLLTSTHPMPTCNMGLMVGPTDHLT